MVHTYIDLVLEIILAYLGPKFQGKSILETVRFNLVMNRGKIGTQEKVLN